MAFARSSFVRLMVAVAVALLAASPGNAASIGITPAFSVCETSCASLTVQITLGLGEIDADSFGFEIHIDDASLVGLSPGPIAGNPIAGMFGTFDLLVDGTTLLGQLNSGPASFDGPTTFAVATIPISAHGNGTATFTFLSAEIRCETCNAGAGQQYAATNAPNGFLAQVTVVPEPGSFGLVALGLGALGAARRRSRREGGVR